MARNTTLAVKLYVNDSNVHSGKDLTPEELASHAQRACDMSKQIGGVVELHIVLEGGRGRYIDVYNSKVPRVYNDGMVLYAEEQG